MGHSRSGFGPKAYCVQAMHKVNGHLVKNFTSSWFGREGGKTRDFARRKARSLVVWAGGSVAFRRSGNAGALLGF
jgi:hypothetical protein